MLHELLLRYDWTTVNESGYCLLIVLITDQMHFLKHTGLSPHPQIFRYLNVGGPTNWPTLPSAQTPPTAGRRRRLS